MRTWGRATRVLFCGSCRHRPIALGDPVLFVATEKITRRLVRCVDCSGPAPPDLPAMPALKTPGDFSMLAIGAMKPKTRGALKASARKEWTPYREPGEDG